MRGFIATGQDGEEEMSEGLGGGGIEGWGLAPGDGRMVVDRGAHLAGEGQDDDSDEAAAAADVEIDVPIEAGRAVSAAPGPGLSGREGWVLSGTTRGVLLHQRLVAPWVWVSPQALGHPGVRARSRCW
jgi:hypothetical protein